MSDWRKTLLERHEKEISSLRQGIEWMEEGKFSTGSFNSNGVRTDTTGDSIATYKRIVADLEELVRKIKIDIVDRPA